MAEQNLLDRIYHPLLDVDLPTLSGLVKRCDPQASAVLLAAGRFSVYREQCLAGLRQAYTHYRQPPSPTRSIDIERLAEPYVTEMDAVRSLLALNADHLKTLLFTSRTQQDTGSWRASEEFFDSAAHWHRELPHLPTTAPPQTIEKRWARRWGMALLREPHLRIDIPTLTASLAHAFPPRWLTVYCDALITREEAYNWYVSKTSVGERKVRPLPRVPAAYVDRHDSLAQIKEGLRHSPGVFVVSEDLVMRKRLVDVLTAPVPFVPQFDWALVVGSPPFGEIDKCLHVRGYRGAVFAMTADELSQDPWVFDSTESSRQSMVNASLEFFRGLATLKPSDHFNFAVFMTPDEHRALHNHVPEAGNVPVIMLPQSDSKDVLLAYLAHLPVYHDEKKVDLGLGLLLDYLSGKETPPECFSPASIPHFVDKLSSAQSDLGLDVPGIPPRSWEVPDTEPVPLHSDAEQARRPFTFVERRLRVNAARRQLKRMLATVGEFFVEYIGDTKDLDTLVGVHRTLAHLEKSDSVAANYMEAGSVAQLLGRAEPDTSD